MMHLPASVRVYLCLSPCDMRRSFDGLHALAETTLVPAASGRVIQAGTAKGLPSAKRTT